MLEKIIDFTVDQMEIEHSSCFGGVCPMTKTASYNHLDNIEQKKNHAYLHVIAMGAGDFYGQNNNGDFFYEKDLKEYFKTFEAAGTFIQHFNKDPSKSIGKVIKAIYNDDMHRVELLIEISKKKAPEIYADIARGVRIKVSMGVKVPQEMCSFCGAITKASLANRCEHLKFNMHQQMPNGQVVYAINIPPLNFFDISIVRKPADAQGHALFQKVASDETDEMLEDKIATLVKYMDAINSLPPAVSVDDMDTFKKSFSPEMIVKIIHAKGLILKPSEAMYIGTDMKKDEFDGCRDHCDNPSFIKVLLDKLKSQPPCAIIKSASHLDYSNPFIEKLEVRTLLVKEAMSHIGEKDFFGNSRKARPGEIARRAFKRQDYSQYKVNFADGKSVTLSKRGFGLSKDIPEYYIDLVDDGFAYNITGIRQNGDETLLYSGDK